MSWRRLVWSLKASAPAHKITLSLDYKIDKFSALVRLSNFAGVDIVNYNDEVDHYNSRTTTDFSVSYTAKKKYTFTIGGNNVLDEYPTNHDPGYTETGGMWEALQMGFSGAFFFGRVSIKL